MDGMQSESNPSGVGKVTRRSIAKQVFCVAATGASLPLEPLLGANEAAQAYQPTKRMAASFRYRMLMARKESVNPGFQADNGDSRKFTDFSCAYSKALLHEPDTGCLQLQFAGVGALPWERLAGRLRGRCRNFATTLAPKGDGPFYDARGHGTEVLP